MDGDWNEFGSEYDERDGPWCGYTDDHADDFNGLDAFGDLSGDTPLRVPGQSRARISSASVVDPLPEPWREEHDLSGRLYYYNTVSEESTFVRPRVRRMMRADSIRSPTLRGDAKELLVAFRELRVYSSCRTIDAFSKPVGLIEEGVRFIAMRVSEKTPSRDLIGRHGQVVGIAPPHIWYQLQDQQSDFFGRPAFLCVGHEELIYTVYKNEPVPKSPPYFGMLVAAIRGEAAKRFVPVWDPLSTAGPTISAHLYPVLGEHAGDEFDTVVVTKNGRVWGHLILDGTWIKTTSNSGGHTLFVPMFCGSERLFEENSDVAMDVAAAGRGPVPYHSAAAEAPAACAPPPPGPISDQTW